MAKNHLRCGVIVGQFNTTTLSLTYVGDCGPRAAPMPTAPPLQAPLLAATTTSAPAPWSGSNLPTVRYSDIADGRPDSLEEAYIGAYETQYGYSVKIGDIVAVDRPTGSSVSGSGSTIGAGSNGLGVAVSRVTAVQSNWFTTVYNGTYAASVGKMVGLGFVSGLAGQTLDPALFMAPASLSGAEIRVLRMKLGGTKKRPVVWMECELVSLKDKANSSGIITIADYDDSIRAGEIYNPNFITREIAIGKLMEAKGLLDMGVYTAEQFDEVKAKYARFVTP